ncbi:MAG: hypothetical protein ACKVS8_07585 [Phycisphaerales bacterium]
MKNSPVRAHGIAFALLAVCGHAVAAAQAPAPDAGPEWPDMASPNDYVVQLQPRVWYVSPGGKLSLPSTTGVAGGYIRTNDLDLDQPRISPYAEMSIKADAWRFTFSGADYSLSHDATAPFAFTLGSTPVAGGAAFHTDFDFATFNLSAAYRFYEIDFGAEGGDAADQYVLRLEALGGIRFYDLDIRIRNTLGSTSGTDQFYGEPFAGARTEFQIARDFSIDLELTAGGLPVEDHSVYSIDVAVGFSWRPVDAVAVQIGWRQLAFSMEDDSGPRQFKYEGTLAGLFAGVVIRF